MRAMSSLGTALEMRPIWRAIEKLSSACGGQAAGVERRRGELHHLRRDPAAVREQQTELDTAARSERRGEDDVVAVTGGDHQRPRAQNQ